MLPKAQSRTVIFGVLPSKTPCFIKKAKNIAKELVSFNGLVKLQKIFELCPQFCFKSNETFRITYILFEPQYKMIKSLFG